jgi:hypothetical protein
LAVLFTGCKTKGKQETNKEKNANRVPAPKPQGMFTDAEVKLKIQEALKQQEAAAKLAADKKKKEMADSKEQTLKSLVGTNFYWPEDYTKRAAFPTNTWFAGRKDGTMKYANLPNDDVGVKDAAIKGCIAEFKNTWLSPIEQQLMVNVRNK